MKQKTITFRVNELEEKRIQDIKNLLKIINKTIPDEVLTNSYIIHLAIYTLKEQLTKEIEENI